MSDSDRDQTPNLEKLWCPPEWALVCILRAFDGPDDYDIRRAVRDSLGRDCTHAKELAAAAAKKLSQRVTVALRQATASIDGKTGSRFRRSWQKPSEAT